MVVTDGCACVLVSVPHFQQFLERKLEGVKGMRAVADDILVYGEGKTMAEARNEKKLWWTLKTPASHRREKETLSLIRSSYNSQRLKCHIVGYLLTNEGIKADPTIMPKPTNVKSVQRLLGMVNYKVRVHKRRKHYARIWYLCHFAKSEDTNFNGVLMSDFQKTLQSIKLNGYLAVSDERKLSICELTKQDEMLQQVIQAMKHGWSEQNAQKDVKPP